MTDYLVNEKLNIMLNISEIHLNEYKLQYHCLIQSWPIILKILIISFGYTK